MNVEQVSNWTGDLPLESLPLDLEPPALEFDQGQLIQFDISNQDPKTWDSNPLQSPPTAPAVDTGQWQAYCESSTPAITFPPGDMISRLVPTTTVTHLRFGSVALKHATVLISNILSAFPQVMLRRQTFPPFIHGHWHTSSLPEKLASCMSISQLFSTRASETQAFLWRTIQAEDQRFRDELMTLSPREIHSAIQAVVIYIIMIIVDRGTDRPELAERMIWTFKILSLRFRDLMGDEYFSNTEGTHPSMTWEDWVFAETRRRVTCLWFVLSRVFSFQAFVSCTGRETEMPLVSNRRLWEARSREEWEDEKAIYEMSRPMTKLGELLEAKKNSGNPLNARRLENWEAGADTMAVMMNIALVLGSHIE
ncbi:MAG: hypothetical protein MMC23_004032 [Stictis urceolatum]|nr:hypothetical protein [Stictis urceolata]